jgi:hypothetical protein
VFRRERLRTYLNIGPNTAPGTFAFSHNLWFAADDPSRSAPELPVPEVGGIAGLDPLIGPEGSIGPESPAAGAGIALDVDGYYVKNYSKPENITVKKREEGIASKAAGLLGIAGFAATIIYIINPNWLDFANFSLPNWLSWAGLGIAILGFSLLQWAQITLANSWSDTPRMMKEQALVTSGPYKFIRHPIYTAFILILGSPLLISAN